VGAAAPKNIGSFDFFRGVLARRLARLHLGGNFAMHRVILGAGVVIMEGLTNLARACRAGRVEVRGPPSTRIAGTEGAPRRDSSRRYMDRSRRVLLRTERLTRSFGKPDRGERGEPPRYGRASLRLDHRAQRGGQDHLLPIGLRARWSRPPGAVLFQEERHQPGCRSIGLCRLGIAKVLPDHQHLPRTCRCSRKRAGSRLQGYARLVSTILVARRPGIAGLPASARPRSSPP